MSITGCGGGGGGISIHGTHILAGASTTKKAPEVLAESPNRVHRPWRAKMETYCPIFRM